MTEVVPPLRRVNPIPGMMIDVETWRTAHDYHRDHARLHHLALHGWGIVRGLDVLVGKSVNALLIQPGVAIDPAGNFVIVDQEQVCRVKARTRGTIYLALRYRDAPGEHQANPATAGPQTRVLESFSIEERTLAPTDTDVELARIDFDPQSAPIRPAADPNNPGQNEVDTRWRMLLSSAGVPAPRLTEQAQSAPPPAQTDASQMDGMHARLDDIARQVSVLWQRPQASATGRSDAGSEGAVSDGATDLVLLDLRQRFEGLAQRVNDLGERLQVLSTEREDAAGQHQALADQLGELVRQGDAAAPELAQLRERLDHVTPELERLAASVEPLQRQLQQLADRSEAVVERAWQTPDAPPERELRLAVGRMRADGWDQHRAGLRLLGQELAATVEPSARVLDEVQLSDVAQVDLLYLTGYSALGLDEAEIQGIARVLEAGGVVLAEGCAAGPSGEAGAREFAFSFIELAQRLGRRLTRVERTHKLFEARHVFGDPPAGARPARVLEADGVIYSDADYGCAWQGGAPQQPLPRSAIRDAFEFGVNMAVYHRARG
jgi:hypothetical protein